MVFVKVVKTPSYYSRLQVPLRRRREGRTDYKARRNLCRQDRTRYNTPKYRFVVRFTNKRVIAQVAYATIEGDRIVASADSVELIRYGMPVGLKNYAAAYATGLLCARRLLNTFGLEDACVGVTDVSGAEFHIEENETDKPPPRCVLDVGLVRTTTGHRVFGALKGATDGGLHIPHSVKRFPGYKKDSSSDDKYDPAVHRKRIFGGHVAEYMKTMKEEDPDKFEKHFAHYVKNTVTPDNLEAKIQAVHSAIRQAPMRVKKQAKPPAKIVRDGNVIKTKGKDGAEVKYLRCKRLSKEARAERVQAKLQKIGEAMGAAMAE